MRWKGSKRGVSEVILTIIMVVLSLAAVVVIWAIVNNILSESAESINLESLTLDMKIQSVKIEDENITVNVKRNVGKGNLTGILFVFFDGKNSESQEIEISLKELQTMTFTFTLNELNASEILTVSIAPIFLSGSGNQIIAGPTHIGKVKSSGNESNGNGSCVPAADPSYPGVCGAIECGFGNNGTCSSFSCGDCNSTSICSSNICVETGSNSTDSIILTNVTANTTITIINDIDGDGINDTLTNTKITVQGNLSSYDNFIAISTYEGYIGQDLNGDGDTFDTVLSYYNTNTNTLVNTNIVKGGFEAAISNNVIAFSHYEELAGEDLNGDGDTSDYILRYYNIITNNLVNTGVVIDWGDVKISNNIIGNFHTSPSYLNIGIDCAICIYIIIS